jgi:hypothetical protein
MTNADVLSVAASNGELVTQCACTRKLGRQGKANPQCRFCLGHGWLKLCEKCSGCGMTSNKVCDECKGRGSHSASAPIRPNQKKPASSLA